MNLDETLQLLALQVPVDPEQLVKFAAEDSVGGWDLDKGGWPTGSLWSVEGKVLYALIRALRPEKVVEVGTHRGCSTTHIATALEINGQGEVITIDTAEGVGDLIPQSLLHRVILLSWDGKNWIGSEPDESIDIIYEDADHSAETSRDVALLAMRKLKPGGLLITHDAAHDYAWLGDGSQINSDVGETIRRGLTDALGEQYRVYRTDPSDCGFALWQKPGFTKDIHSTPDEKPKNDFITADGEHLKIVQDDGAVPPGLAQAIAQVKAGDPAAQDAQAAKFAIGTPVKVTNLESQYFEQTGEVYDNYRSGQEPQAYGVRFKDGREFWVQEIDLDLAAASDQPTEPADDDRLSTAEEHLAELKGMNRDELVAYADENEIDLTGSRTNADRVNKIWEAEGWNGPQA